jgi:GNAT superfamily N-acetyltransferase
VGGLSPGKNRRIRPLAAADLPKLPEPCARCTFWESSLTDLASSDGPADRPRVKAEWAEAVTERWGYCGVQACDNGTVLGFLTMAPAVLVPRLGAFATTPVSSDAAVLMSVRVLEEHRGVGIGRQLVQAAAGLLARRDIRALEAVGTYHDGPSCMLPTSWLESVGFAIVRAHPITPRLRMDLQSSLRWREDLGAAWSRFTSLVTSPPPPEPNGVSWRTPVTATRHSNP